MNIEYMKIAIEESKKAFLIDEVPVGAVIVKDNIIIAKAFNKKNSCNMVTGHAELIVIEMASKLLNNWRLIDCDIYITLQPCPMCISALQQSRIRNIYFGIDNKDPICTEIIQLLEENSKTNSKINISGGYCEKEIGDLMSLFFKAKRKK